MTTLSAQSASLFGPRGSKSEIEEGRVLAPKFDAQGLLPCIVTDHGDGAVLMLAYMNAEALARTIETGEAHYWSRSRGELWHKGATSGHVQKVVEIRVDCDQDAILLVVEQTGGACHVGYRSCFYRAVPLGNTQHGAPRTLAFREAGKVYDPDMVYGKA